MKIFALVVFSLHALAELTFGANAFLSGGFSSQSVEALENQPANIAGAARFLGTALMSLGLLGAIVLFGPGVGSSMGRSVAVLLALFHGIGVVGVLLTAQQNTGYMTQGAAPLIVHLVLALGFLIVLARHRLIRID
ncbi:hypothetical protein [Loktanella sp. Alg231-35]|uniref:hypothetical protein n=1 Tax=Loktanella sp. Alg231-35 TaxID=1922220 RepID=UPI000D54C174|nr:hypothetical protein [Loktanella sp. Alg231-35]